MYKKVVTILMLFFLGFFPFFWTCGSNSNDTLDNLVSDEVCDEVLADNVTFESGMATIQKQSGGSVSVTVELAQNSTQRSQGLMCRSSVSEGTGMLFIFSSDQTGGFWMKNTYVSLDIAYIDSNGVIVDIREMRPCTAPLDEDGKLTDTWPAVPERCTDDQQTFDGGTYPAGYVPSTSYRQALEVPQGYFAAQGVTLGDTVSQN